jgi:cyanophycin synthetase
MMTFAHHPKLLAALSLAYRLRAGLHRRQSAVRAAHRQRAAFYEAAWREAAERFGGEIAPLGDDIYEICIGDFRTKVCCNYTAADDPVTLALAGSKPAVYRLLERTGLPVPRRLEFTLGTFPAAVEFMNESGGRCVVKPAKNTGAGNGVTANIAGRRQLIRAAASAAVHCRELLIEEQIPGDSYRLLYLDGRLLDAVVRRQPAVIGDGRSTVRALVDRTNTERTARGFAKSQVLLTCDAEMKGTLAQQGLSLNSVPPAGARVVVKTVINENAAEENESARRLLCDAVIEAGGAAAAAVGAKLAGVDIITRNPALPLEETGGAVLEVNTTPGYYHHYHKADDDACPVAVPVLDYLLRRAGASAAPLTLDYSSYL